MLTRTESVKTIWIGMTEHQADCLRIFLDAGKGGHADELKIAAQTSPAVADNVHDALVALREALKDVPR